MTPIEHAPLRGRPRLLLVFPARQAATSISRVLHQVPARLAEAFDLQALVIDDASPDATFEIASELRHAGTLPFPLEVLSATAEHGYGGSQKLGFQYAIDHRFDCVAIIECTSSVGPAELEPVLTPLVQGRADATLLAPSAGIRERVATMTLSRILRLPLKSLHDGLRAYRVEALRQIPFALDTDDQHIDTEILIQLLFAGLRVVDVPTSSKTVHSTSKPSWSHVFNALRAVTRARMQRMNLFYERRFDCDPTEQENARYHLKLDFDSSHRRAFAQIPRGSRVLDLGCAGGYFAQLLERELECKVTAFDREPLPPGIEVTEFHEWDLDQGPPEVDYSDYDVVIMLDVIEHLRSPEDFVRRLYQATSRLPSLQLIFTTANVGFLLTRIGLLLGQFNYGKRGILDLTHTRLFTVGTFRRLFRQDGFRILHEEGIPAPFALATTNKFLSSSLLGVSRLLIRPFRRLFSYQLLLVLQPRSSLELLLSEASEVSRNREARLQARA